MLVYMLFLLPGFLFALWAQNKVKSTFAKYVQVPTATGITGERAAEILINHLDLNVSTKLIGGQLTDHYDPRTKSVALSQSSVVNSVASVAIVAHELGHAMQDKQGDVLLNLRGALVPAVNIGSSISPWLIFGGSMLGAASPIGSLLMWIGIIGFGIATVFALLTLPVEFNASSRAMVMIREKNLLSESELSGAKRVLDAAALTYVAAAAQSLLTLLYYVTRFTGGSRNDD